MCIAYSGMQSHCTTPSSASQPEQGAPFRVTSLFPTALSVVATQGRVGKRNDLSVDVDDDEDGRRRAKRRGSTGGESSGLGPSPPATPNTGRLGGGAGGASGRCKGGLSLGGGLVDMGAFDQDGGRGDVWLSQVRVMHLSRDSRCFHDRREGGAVVG
jgi:hypothetical protein